MKMGNFIFTWAWLSQFEIELTLVVAFQLVALVDAWNMQGIEFGLIWKKKTLWRYIWWFGFSLKIKFQLFAKSVLTWNRRMNFIK